jgi:hypothetical protein
MYDKRDASSCDFDDFSELTDVMEVDKMIHSTQKLIVRVFAGNYNGIQVQPFMTTRIHADFADDIEYEFLYLPQIRRENWNPKKVVDWLLDCDVHFILTHMHQSLSWNCSELLLSPP